MPKKRNRFALPLLFGTLTFALLLFALWPSQPPQATVVVAARDLGAGAVLSAADLNTITLPAELAPADAVADAAALIGQTLAVVRFAGEPVSIRNLGPAVAVGAQERAVALHVKRDRGLAGLLRPGSHVGVVATLPDAGGNVYAKATIENLRVLYVSPEFQARPQAPLSAALTVASGAATSVTPSPSARAEAAANEGIVIVAAPIAPAPLFYVPITETAAITYTLLDGSGVEFADQRFGAGSLELATWTPPVGAPDLLAARTLWVNPVELLAALNAAANAFTLVLMPENPGPYVTSGVHLADLAPVRIETVEPAP